MPVAISFAWTSAPLLCGAKTVTRRAWKERWAASYKPGSVVTALDRLAIAGGKPIARLRILEAPYRQSTAEMPDDDWYAEGFAFLDAHPYWRPRRIFGRPSAPDEFSREGGWLRWKQRAEVMYVVRFELIERFVGIDCERTA